MTVFKCDICKKEITVWMNVNISVGGTNHLINVADMLQYQGYREMCLDCFKKFYDGELPTERVSAGGYGADQYTQGWNDCLAEARKLRKKEVSKE